MIRSKTTLALSGILLSAALCASETALVARAELPDNDKHEKIPYTLASVEGNYGIVGSYSGDLAGLLGSSETVNEDGTGTVELLVILPNSSQQVTMDTVITKAVMIDGVKKATEMRTMQRQPSGLTGQFVTDVLTRRPD